MIPNSSRLGLSQISHISQQFSWPQCEFNSDILYVMKTRKNIRKYSLSNIIELENQFPISAAFSDVFMDKALKIEQWEVPWLE